MWGLRVRALRRNEPYARLAVVYYEEVIPVLEDVIVGCFSGFKAEPPPIFLQLSNSLRRRLSLVFCIGATFLVDCAGAGRFIHIHPIGSAHGLQGADFD